jgi:hypothetical protein
MAGLWRGLWELSMHLLVVPWYDATMAVRKLAVSFEPDLAAQIQEAASSEGVSVSGWLANAAAVKLHLRSLDEWLSAYELDSGSFTAEELEKVAQAWPDSR